MNRTDMQMSNPFPVAGGCVNPRVTSGRAVC